MEKFNINQFNPCNEGAEYYATQPDSKTAWNNCERGDWMLWIAKRLDVDDRLFTLSKAHCANTVRHLMKDQRSIKAIDAAIKYGNGEISREELDKFADAAKDATTDAANDAYTDYSPSSYAYAYASDAAAAAAAYANNAYAAYAAAYADAYTDAAERENQQQTADICRKYLTEEVFNKIKI